MPRTSPASSRSREEYRRRGALVRKLRTDVAATADEHATVAAELASVREQAERAEEERTLLLRRAESGEYLGVQLNAQLDEARTELDTVRATEADARAELDAVRAAEAAARAELEAATAERDDRLRELEAALTTSEAERRTTQAALAGRDERLRRLEQMLAERDEKLRSVEWELAEVGGRIVELEGQLGLESPAPIGASTDAGSAANDHPSE